MDTVTRSGIYSLVSSETSGPHLTSAAAGTTSYKQQLECIVNTGTCSGVYSLVSSKSSGQCLTSAAAMTTSYKQRLECIVDTATCSGLYGRVFLKTSGPHLASAAAVTTSYKQQLECIVNTGTCSGVYSLVFSKSSRMTAGVCCRRDYEFTSSKMGCLINTVTLQFGVAGTCKIPKHGTRHLLPLGLQKQHNTLLDYNGCLGQGFISLYIQSPSGTHMAPVVVGTTKSSTMKCLINPDAWVRDCVLVYLKSFRNTPGTCCRPCDTGSRTKSKIRNPLKQ